MEVTETYNRKTPTFVTEVRSVEGTHEHEPYPISNVGAYYVLTEEHDFAWAKMEFDRLAHEWLQRKGPVSSPIQKAMLPPYLRIIGLGPVVLPLLLKEVEDRPDHWFIALEMITGENPVAESERGDILQMAAAWVRWGKQRGYLSIRKN